MVSTWFARWSKPLRNLNLTLCMEMIGTHNYGKHRRSKFNHEVREMFATQFG